MRRMAIVDPKEILHPAKSIESIPAFTDDMRAVLEKKFTSLMVGEEWG